MKLIAPIIKPGEEAGIITLINPSWKELREFQVRIGKNQCLMGVIFLHGKPKDVIGRKLNKITSSRIMLVYTGRKHQEAIENHVLLSLQPTEQFWTPSIGVQQLDSQCAIDLEHYTMVM